MKVVLELQDHPSNVRRITIRHDIVIGRGSDCNLRLSAPQISRRHCFLHIGRDSVSVTDLDSSNGTFVDGRRIAAGKRYEITDGVQLALGPIRFIVHMRAETVAADTRKLKSQAGVADQFSAANSDHYPVAEHDFTDDSSTLDGRSLAAGARAPIDYSDGQSGKSAEPHAAKTKHVENQFSVSGSSGFFTSEPDPMDSRLEIIDFGRRLSEESSSTDETRAISSRRNTGQNEKAEDGELQWASALNGSSETPEDIDVLSIADDSSINFSFEDGPTMDAAPIVHTDENEITINKEVPETADPLNDAEDILENDGKSNWFSGDDAEPDYQTDSPEAAADMDAAERADEDEIDPNLQDFLKGF